MQCTLQEHLLSLENKIQALRDALTTSSLTAEENAHIVEEIKVAELAITKYLKAFELEQKVS